MVIHMGKIAFVYWSGTGNTDTMGNAVEDGAEKGVLFRAGNRLSAGSCDRK